MKIAIDIDSTLHHYWDQFAEVAQRRHGVDLPYQEQHTWGVHVLEPEQVRAVVMETHGEDYVAAAVPYPGAIEAVTRWHEAGHWIHITSHRSTVAHEATALWLEQHGIPFDDLYCSYDKVTRCEELGVDLLVDDSPVNIARARERGIAVARLRHPWNREACESGEVVCADDWFELDRALARRLGI